MTEPRAGQLWSRDWMFPRPPLPDYYHGEVRRISGIGPMANGVETVTYCDVTADKYSRWSYVTITRAEWDQWAAGAKLEG